MAHPTLEKLMHLTDCNLSEAVPSSTEVKREWSTPQIEERDLASAESTHPNSSGDGGTAYS